MSRIKRGVASSKRRKYVLQRAKGYLGRAKTNFRAAKERLLHADKNSYRSRKTRKRDFRQLWIARINGALDQTGSGLSYSKFMSELKKSGNTLNRKSLSEIAIRDVDSFKEIVSSISISK